MSVNYSQNAQEILISIGGKENVISTAHCATRLRLVLKDESIVDYERLLSIEVVKGNFSHAGQFQIIIGSGTVNEVFKEFIQLVDIEEVSKTALKAEADKQLKPIQKLLKTLSDVFIPIIPALIASGLLMGLNNVLTASGLFYSGKSLVEANPEIADFSSMVNTFASAAYAFLPVLIGFSATKKFGGNPYLGAALGMIMVSGDLLNAYGYGEAVLTDKVPYWDILGLQIAKVGYQGTVLPILVSSYLLAKLESFLHKKIPEYLDNLLTPMLSLLLTAFITFLIIGGVMRTAGDSIADFIMWSRETLGALGGSLLGFFSAPLTVTGMHHSLLPIDIQLVATGGSFLLAIGACSNVSQGAATLATLFLTDNKKMRTIAASAGISALLGITEPAMFGVNLKLKYPFYGAMFASAIGSAYVSAMGVLNISPGPAGVLGFVSVRSDDMVNFLIGVLLSMAISFVSTIFLAKSQFFKNKLV